MKTLTNTTTVASEVRQFVVENFLFGKGEGLSDSESFLENGMVDSTGVLELIDFIERQYGFRVADEETIPENLDGVDRIANYVCGKLNSMVAR
jgi:acyl carrier protein